MERFRLLPQLRRGRRPVRSRSAGARPLQRQHRCHVGSTPVATIPDISTIAVNPDSYNPCVPPDAPGTPTLHCDLRRAARSRRDSRRCRGRAAALPRSSASACRTWSISPFTRKHYVSHIPMDHTAVIKFVENRFIGAIRAPDRPRCRAAQPAGLLRLHECSVGHAADSAGSGDRESLGLQLVHSRPTSARSSIEVGGSELSARSRLL